MIIKFEDFKKRFDSSFWKAFKPSIYENIPDNPQDREKILNSVYDSIDKATYFPSIPHTEIIKNKGFGVARIIPVFKIEDYCVYYFCIKELEDWLCVNRVPNTFGGWSLGGKIRRQEKEEIENESTEYGRYSFNPMAWIFAFKEFNSLLFSQLDKGDYAYAIQFDLANFYDSVRLDILERKIREQADPSKGWVVSLLFFFLNHWNRRNTGLHPQVVGLPQDALADCSRILANFYLQEYDSFAEKVAKQKDGSYFRYADDQFILLKNTHDIEGILLVLTKKLDRHSLRVNQKKVSIWKREELIDNRCHDIQKIFDNDGDKKNYLKIEKFVDAYLRIPKSKLKHKWNEGTPLLTRILFSDFEKIPLKKGKSIFLRLISEIYLLNAKASYLDRIYILSSHFSSPKKFINRIEKISKKTIHNSFHYEALTLAKKNNLKDLQHQIESRINEIRSLC